MKIELSFPLRLFYLREEYLVLISWPVLTLVQNFDTVTRENLHPISPRGQYMLFLLAYSPVTEREILCFLWGMKIIYI
jgi:hypothetical protein